MHFYAWVCECAKYCYIGSMMDFELGNILIYKFSPNYKSFLMMLRWQLRWRACAKWWYLKRPANCLLLKAIIFPGKPTYDALSWWTFDFWSAIKLIYVIKRVCSKTWQLRRLLMSRKVMHSDQVEIAWILFDKFNYRLEIDSRIHPSGWVKVLKVISDPFCHFLLRSHKFWVQILGYKWK